MKREWEKEQENSELTSGAMSETLGQLGDERKHEEKGNSLPHHSRYSVIDVARQEK